MPHRQYAFSRSSYKWKGGVTCTFLADRSKSLSKNHLQPVQSLWSVCVCLLLVVDSCSLPTALQTVPLPGFLPLSVSVKSSSFLETAQLSHFSQWLLPSFLFMSLSPVNSSQFFLLSVFFIPLAACHERSLNWFSLNLCECSNPLSHKVTLFIAQ